MERNSERQSVCWARTVRERHCFAGTREKAQLVFRAMQCCVQCALCYDTDTFLLIFIVTKAVFLLNGSSAARRQLLKACGLWTLGCGGLYVPAIQRNNVTV